MAAFKNTFLLDFITLLKIDKKKLKIIILMLKVRIRSLFNNPNFFVLTISENKLSHLIWNQKREKPRTQH